MFTWTGQGLALGLADDSSLGWPGFMSNVTIPRCRTIVVDININVQLFSIVVFGTLEIENRALGQVSLRSTCITVKCANRGSPGGCGRILAGTHAKPFAGRLEFLMSGDELTESPQCGGMKGKYFTVEAGATLALYGDSPAPAWGRLRKTAETGDHTLFVLGHMGWRQGDQLILGTTSHLAAEMEWLTVSASRTVPAIGGGLDTEVTLSEAVKHRHVGVTEQHGAHELSIRAEIGLWLRPRAATGAAQPAIRIAGVNNDQPNFRFKTMDVAFYGLIFHALP